jgi:chromosome partitioning protein
LQLSAASQQSKRTQMIRSAKAEIIIIGNTKGGVGKTTLAFNFAVALAQAGRDVLLVDSDRQATATINAQIRTDRLKQAGRSPDFTTIALYDEAVIIQVPQLATKYDDIVIDVGGRDNPSLRSALLIPNATLLIPVKPRSYDLWGADDMAKLVQEARARGNTSLRAITVINEADHLQDADNAAAAAELSGHEGLEHSPTRLVRRKAYPNAAATGHGVTEHSDEKASEELFAVLSFVHPQFSKTGVSKDGNR